MNKCSSFRQGLVCADGFIQVSACRGALGCVQCGHVSSAHLPHCVRDELPQHFVKDDGSPAFYRQAQLGKDGG